MGTVKQDANGVPEEWTLLHAGVNRLVKNGKDYELHLSVEDLDAIAAYQAKKGEAIPIDSNHYLHILAEKHGDPYLGEKRLLHTLNVGYLSAELAVRFGADPDKALLAGALHDCAKELDIDSQREMAADYCGDLFTDKKLLHSPAGAVFARESFGEKDVEILDAICYHTTGRGNMSSLEKIVYLADKIEPARDYMDLVPIRKMAETDLDEACRMTALAIKAKTESLGKVIHPSNVDMLCDLGIK